MNEIVGRIDPTTSYPVSGKPLTLFYKVGFPTKDINRWRVGFTFLVFSRDLQLKGHRPTRPELGPSSPLSDVQTALGMQAFGPRARRSTVRGRRVCRGGAGVGVAM